ncbi:MAG: RND family efflux transporter MFP subunit [Alteromonadaceae bacterium]|jgi:RND family efflux transporter MFP subunit
MLVKTIKLRILAYLVIVTFFSFVCYAILSSPQQSQRKPSVAIAPSVEVISTTSRNHSVTIAAQGLIVAPNKAISLIPQVSGIITITHQNFILGGFIPAGEPIVRIEQTDYTIALDEAQAKLTLAQASLTMEQGQQRLAKKEFKLNDNKFIDDGNNKSLALRVPQLKQAQARVQLAQSEVEKARVSLKRTNLTIPYDVRILSINTTIGELINQQTAVAVLVKANKRWLALKFKAKDIDRLSARTADKKGSFVNFYLNKQTYQGEVISLLADLVSSTKMAGAIVEIIPFLSPSTMDEDAKLESPLLIGTHISATIAAGTINDAYAIPIEALINNKQVFIVDSTQLLQSRPAKLQWQSKDKVIVDIKLNANDQIVTSQVFGIATGTKVNAIKRIELKKGTIL